MTAFALARRTGARFKLRAALAVAGVAIIGALNFDMILLSRGLLLSFADLIDSAGFDVRVTGGNGVPALRLPIADAAALVRDIRRLPEVESAALVRFDQAPRIRTGTASPSCTPRPRDRSRRSARRPRRVPARRGASLQS